MNKQELQVLVACEFSGVVCSAFRERGYQAWSCDLLDTEGDDRYHIQDNVLDVIERYDWHLMIAHPPCTYLCNSGLRWLYVDGKKSNGWDYDRCEKMYQGAEFYNKIVSADIPLIAAENPRMHPYAITVCGHPDQYVQLWQFGDLESKETGFKLKNLPKLIGTEHPDFVEHKVHNASGKDRWMDRSRTRPNIAIAMVQQWGAAMEEFFS